MSDSRDSSSSSLVNKVGEFIRHPLSRHRTKHPCSGDKHPSENTRVGHSPTSNTSTRYSEYGDMLSIRANPSLPGKGEHPNEGDTSSTGDTHTAGNISSETLPGTRLGDDPFGGATPQIKRPGQGHGNSTSGFGGVGANFGGGTSGKGYGGSSLGDSQFAGSSPRPSGNGLAGFGCDASSGGYDTSGTSYGGGGGGDHSGGCSAAATSSGCDGASWGE